MKHQIILILLFSTSISHLFSQNKKEQIDALNYSIDSLNLILKTTVSNYEDSLRLLKSKQLLENEKLQQKIDDLTLQTKNLKDQVSSLKTENSSLNMEIEDFKIKQKEFMNRNESNFILIKYTNQEDDMPYTDLGFKDKSDSIIKISTVVGWLEGISIDEYNNYKIPKNAKFAVGGWFAGGGDYFYYVEENGVTKIYKGWIDEGDDSSFHWVICHEIE